MAEPIINPELPFVGDVPSGLQPGKMIRFQGITHPNSDRFNINLATGPNSKPRDDTALHISVRLNQGYIARNTYKDGIWGDEQGSGKLPIGQAQSFEIIVLVDPHHYKIAVNGQHYCEFPHRIPYQQVSHLLVDGDVAITLISFEGIPLPGDETATQASSVNAQGPQFGGPQYGPPPGAYGVPPPNYGGYGPPPQMGGEPQSQISSFFDQAQDVLANAIKTAATEKLLSSILPSGQSQQQGYAHQNARYGIYPDLPTQDPTPTPNQGANPQDAALSNLIAGSGGTISSGPQPTIVTGAANTGTGEQQTTGPFESLLSGLLSGKGQGQQNTTPGQADSHDVLSGLLSSLLNPKSQAGGQGTDKNQQPAQGTGSDVLSGILSSLLSSNQNQQMPSAQSGVPHTASSPDQSSDVLSGILSSLISPSQGPQDVSQPSTNAQNPNQPSSKQGPASDVLSGILSNLLSSHQGQPGPQSPIQPPENSQISAQYSNGQGKDALSAILSNLLSPNQDRPATVQTQNVPPQSGQTTNAGQQSGGINAELIAGLLQGLLLKAQQHDMTRPIQETNPTGDNRSPAPDQNPQQQYGQYPHPPQQEQRGPMESLLSGLLSGGGQQQQQQQPHNAGGDALGGLLGSLAGSLFNKPNQGQH